tara:strand:- start:1611 stop:2447 length:837 start_codon:yes stop_codon:yes gene_type:complete
MYSAIIGLNPSKGARSPELWEKAYQSYSIKSSMIAIDIENKDKLFQKLNELEKDKYFQGGAIAFPYKEKVFEWLNGSVEKEVLNIGAVNNIYRDEKGNLKGSNTDGIASKNSFYDTFTQIKKRNVLILGYGGAGKAVTGYLGRDLAMDYQNNQVYLATRNEKDQVDANSMNIKWINWNRINEIRGINTIINCTSLGNLLNKDLSPLSENWLLENKIEECFDIIYDPEKTLLLSKTEKNGAQILNGLQMNLYQAAIAFKNCNPTAGKYIEIVNIMNSSI